MNKKLFFWTAYIISIIFILSGAVNNGFSGYFMAIPFMILALWISKLKLKINLLFYFSLFLIIASIIINQTQTRNPLFYPILKDGYLETLNDGYIKKYSDGSGSFTTSKKVYNCTGTGCGGEAEFIEIKKGSTYKVTGIKISHPDFGTNINILTEIGEFSELDYKTAKYNDGPNIKVNKTVISPWIEKFGILLYWPLIPIQILSYIQEIL